MFPHFQFPFIFILRSVPFIPLPSMPQPHHHYHNDNCERYDTKTSPEPTIIIISSRNQTNQPTTTTCLDFKHAKHISYTPTHTIFYFCAVLCCAYLCNITRRRRGSRRSSIESSSTTTIKQNKK